MRKNIYQKIFFCSTVSLVLFGILGQVLAEMMGYSTELASYLMCMIPVIFAGYLAYWITKFLKKKPKKTIQWLIKTAGVMILLWTILVNVMCNWFQMKEFGETSYDKECGTIEQSKEVKHLISKCHFIGKGDRYYNYPDEIAEGKIVYKEEMIQEARIERDKAEIVFGSYRRNLLLPVLSYQYGLWVNYLYLLIVLIWKISAIGAFWGIQGKIEKIFFAVCGIEIFSILAITGVSSLGLIPFPLSHPFATNWFFNLVCLSPQLGIMLGILGKETEHSTIYEGNQNESEAN